jgi:hypothetical protein
MRSYLHIPVGLHRCIANKAHFDAMCRRCTDWYLQTLPTAQVCRIVSIVDSVTLLILCRGFVCNMRNKSGILPRLAVESSLLLKSKRPTCRWWKRVWIKNVSPLNAELNPICHLLVLLGDLTFMGPCIVSIFQYISNKMQSYTVYLYLETVLHISGGIFHPSSGAHTTVSTASGICHTVTAICR